MDYGAGDVDRYHLEVVYIGSGDKLAWLIAVG